MARVYSNHKGKSGSVRPVRDQAPDWQPLSGPEVEKQVVTMAKEGKSTSTIGIYLRDQFGVPDVRLATGKSVTQILAGNDIRGTLPEDIANLLRKVVNLQEHLPKNRKDLHNRRSLELLEARIRRLAKYYRRTGRLAQDWAYSSKTARLLLE